MKGTLCPFHMTTYCEEDFNALIEPVPPAKANGSGEALERGRSL